MSTRITSATALPERSWTGFARIALTWCRDDLRPWIARAAAISAGVRGAEREGRWGAPGAAPGGAMARGRGVVSRGPAEKALGARSGTRGAMAGDDREEHGLADRGCESNG
jgi:hypothetical protein